MNKIALAAVLVPAFCPIVAEECALVGPGWDVAGIIGTGQSLSVGKGAPDILFQPDPLGNLKLELGGELPWEPPGNHEDPKHFLAPLSEPIRDFGQLYPSAYPLNIFGQTLHGAMAHQISCLVQSEFGRSYASVHSVVGEDGQALVSLDNRADNTLRPWEHPASTRGRAYHASLFEIKTIARLIQGGGKSFGVSAVVLTHGETDFGNKDYGAEVAELQRQYTKDIQNITGQTTTVLLYASQQHSFPLGARSRGHSTLAVWKLGREIPEQIICTGPKYQYDYSDDGIHLSALGYTQLGEKNAQVYTERAVAGRHWKPLEPIAAFRRGSNKVVVKFHVPVPPLRWDVIISPLHHEPGDVAEWSLGRGFELLAFNSIPLKILQVEIIDDGGAVEIETASDVPKSGLNVAYALTSMSNNTKPHSTSRVGFLCDSDPFVGAVSGQAQPNYAVAFELDVEQAPRGRN
jgi:hypothetical protein